MSGPLKSHVDVAVIGAGAAGIGAGRRLAAHGLDLILLEARRRLGGRASTHPTELGPAIDLGCEWLHSADRNPWTEIARSLGFTVDERLPDWSSRVMHQLGPGAQQDWFAEREDFYARTESAAAAGTDCDAASLLAPAGRWNGLLDAISTWANGVELARLSVIDHDRYHDSGINWRVLEGYGTLVTRHGADLPVALDCAVERVDWGRRPIVLETARGRVTAAAVIVTLPTNLLAAETVAFAPELPEKTAAAAGLPLGLADKLFLAIAGAAEDFPVDRHMVGAFDRTETAAYQLRPHGWPVIGAYFGGALARGLEREGMPGFTAFALGELGNLLGADMRKRLRPLACSGWHNDPFARGSYSYALPGHAEDRARLAAPVEDRLFFAGEALSPHDFSTAHGAYLSGRAAAEQAIAALKR